MVRNVDSFPIGKEPLEISKQRIKIADSYHYGCSVEGGKLGGCCSNLGSRCLGLQTGREVTTDLRNIMEIKSI